MSGDADEEAKKSLCPQGAMKGQEPGITGRITHCIAYLDISRELACGEQGRVRWGEQVEGRGAVASRR